MRIQTIFFVVQEKLFSLYPDTWDIVGSWLCN